MAKRKAPNLFSWKLKVLAEQRRNLLKMRPQVDEMEAVFQSVDVKFRNFLSGEENKWFTSIYLQSLTKAGDAAPLLRALAQRGYRLKKGAEVKKEDLCIEWDLIKARPDGSEHSVTVKGFLDPGSVVCKKVQVGAEVRTVPIFEMRCEGPSQEVFDAVASSAAVAGVQGEKEALG